MVQVVPQTTTASRLQHHLANIDRQTVSNRSIVSTTDNGPKQVGNQIAPNIPATPEGTNTVSITLTQGASK